MDFKEAVAILLQDSDFFIHYKEDFRVNFLKIIRQEKPNLMSSQGLNTVIDRLYLLLFSFEKDPRREFETFLEKLSNLEIYLEDVIKTSLMLIVKDYCEYLIEERLLDVKRLSALTYLVQVYFEIIDKVSERLTERLREKRREDRTRIEGERRVIIDLFEEGRIREIEILVFYKEVPIVCKSPVLKVDEARIKVKPCGVYPFKPGEEIYLKHPSLPKPVAVKVDEVSTLEEFMWLEILGFADLPQERRKYLRVVPKQPLRIKLEKGEWSTVGVIADISVGGVGVILRDKDELKENDEVVLEFSLPKGRVKVKGIVRNMVELEKAYRVGLEYKLDVKREEIVSDYVMDRQFEILKELKKVSGR